MLDILINTSKCMARKNLKDGINCQCNNNKKLGDYCGIHYKSKKRIRIDEEINITIRDKKKKFTKIDPNNFIFDINKYSIKSLLDFLHYYKIDTENKNKNDIFDIVSNIIKINNKYSKDIKNIIKIQKYFRFLIVKRYLYYKGYPNISSNNEEDFYTFENIKDIHFKNLFSYKDTEDFIYSFDCRSFEKLLETTKQNPYTRNPIDKETIFNYNRMKKLGILIGYNLEEIQKPSLNPEQEFKQKAISIFHKMDELDYHTDMNWFLNLNIKQLYYFYKSAEDIWNYRANLSLTNKIKIIPNNDAFKLPVWDVYKINNKRKLQNIVLSEIDKFISSGIKKEDRVLGAMYMLTALVEVSPSCAEAMPWLIQNVF